MFDIRSLIQQALDTALQPHVKSYWGQKAGPDANEYVVYNLDPSYYTDFADNGGIVRTFSFTIKYFHRETLLQTSSGRAEIKSRENQIFNALEQSEFDVGGPYDLGAYDGGSGGIAGFESSIFDCSYQVVI